MQSLHQYIYIDYTYIYRLYIYIYILHLNKLQGPHVATVTFEMVSRGNFYPREACKVRCGTGSQQVLAVYVFIHGWMHVLL